MGPEQRDRSVGTSPALQPVTPTRRWGHGTAQALVDRLVTMRVRATVTVLTVEAIRLPERQQKLSCRVCGQDSWLRLVVLGELSVVWCDVRHVTTHPALCVDIVAHYALAANPESPGPIWELNDDHEVPETLAAAHPGIEDLLDRLGHHLISQGNASAPVSNGPASGPCSLSELDQAHELLTHYLDDHTPEEGRPDDILLVPITRRELHMIQQATDRLARNTSFTGRVTRDLVLDLLQRARSLIAADPDHVRHVVADHARTVRKLIWWATWWRTHEQRLRRDRANVE